MRKTSHKLKFTLVELIVAMAVFSILLLLMLQFFSGAQRIWNGMEKRNEIYANARIIMDLMTVHLQNIYYTNSGVPFYIDNTDPDSSKIYFATQARNLFPDGNSQKFMTFQRYTVSASENAQQEQLRLAIFSSSTKGSPTSPTYNCFFSPFGATPSIPDFKSATTELPKRLDGLITNDDYSDKIADNITMFQIVPYDFNATSGGFTRVTTSTVKYIPFLLEIKLSMLSPEDFELWVAGGKTDEFRKQHEYTFSRTVYLGDRRDR